MGILQRLTESVIGEQQHYTYRCNVCHATFTTGESHMARVACDACGASDVRAVASQ